MVGGAESKRKRISVSAVRARRTANPIPEGRAKGEGGKPG